MTTLISTNTLYQVFPFDLSAVWMNDLLVVCIFVTLVVTVIALIVHAIQAGAEAVLHLASA